MLLSNWIRMCVRTRDRVPFFYFLRKKNFFNLYKNTESKFQLRLRVHWVQRCWKNVVACNCAVCIKRQYCWKLIHRKSLSLSFSYPNLRSCQTCLPKCVTCFWKFEDFECRKLLLWIAVVSRGLQRLYSMFVILFFSLSFDNILKDECVRRIAPDFMNVAQEVI